MRLALDEAELARGSADVPIGAVVVDPDGQVIGRGHNEREATGDPTAHAEVTMEPCTMCAGAIVWSRLDRLVFGAYAEKAGAVGSLWDVVRDRRLNHRPEVVGGVMADETGARLRDFFTGHRS